jgi:hypothetical protein
MKRRLFLFASWMALAGVARAHVGNPAVVFEGQAGPYPIRAVIRVPGVVPGLAQVSVRVLSGEAAQVTVLPVHWRTGLKGAPAPDQAKPVPGATNLFSAELWLMTSGSYSVHIHVKGPIGAGTAIVPVNSVATRRLPMPSWYGAVLSGLGLLLFGLMASVVGAAIRESVLEPGRRPSRLRIWGSRGAVVIAALVLGTLVWTGKRWWDSVDRDYRNHRMFRPIEVRDSTRLESGRRVLRLELAVPESRGQALPPLVPDHGKLMHLFLIREPALDAFAHIHPVRLTDRHFEVVLPPLPAGSYRLYGDITHETGFSQTLTSLVEIASAPESNPTVLQAAPAFKTDPDDSWTQAAAVGPALSGPFPTQVSLPGGLTVRLETAQPLPVNQDLTLRFLVRDAEGRPATLHPYMGMFSHAAVRRRDGSVFNHIHPVGTISLAAQQVMQLRAQGKDPGIVTAEALEPFCQLPPESQSRRPLDFPMIFPQPGLYRMWVQIKPAEEVLTATFDLEVRASP